MGEHRAVRSVAATLLALASAGCVFRAPELDRIRLEIERRIPGAHFEAETKLTLGRGSLALARRFALDDGEEEERALLVAVHRLELAQYRTRSLPGLEQLSISRAWERQLRRDGWETLVRYAEADEAAWVIYRAEGGEIRELFVGAVDAEELSLVKMRGHLDPVFQQIVDESVVDIPGVFRTEVHAPDGLPGAAAGLESSLPVPASCGLWSVDHPPR